MGWILNLAEVVDLLCLSEAIHRVDQSTKKKRQKSTSDTILAKLDNQYYNQLNTNQPFLARWTEAAGT